MSQFVAIFMWQSFERWIQFAQIFRRCIELSEIHSVFRDSDNFKRHSVFRELDNFQRSTEFEVNFWDEETFERYIQFPEIQRLFNHADSLKSCADFFRNWHRFKQLSQPSERNTICSDRPSFKGFRQSLEMHGVSRNGQIFKWLSQFLVVYPTTRDALNFEKWIELHEMEVFPEIGTVSDDLNGFNKSKKFELIPMILRNRENLMWFRQFAEIDRTLSDGPGSGKLTQFEVIQTLLRDETKIRRNGQNLKWSKQFAGIHMLSGG
jgi:hypothetical protein